jgi:hypothetical protein
VRIDRAEYIGKPYSAVEHQLTQIAADGKYTIAIMEPDSPANIDRETHRLNVYVDADFKVTDLRFG